jgi:ferritin-like metal-binding protein YciE
MAKANKKAASKSAKAAAPKKGAKSAKAAAPKKGMKSAKAAAPKKGMKSAKAAAPKKGMKSAKAAAPKKGMKSAKAAAPKKGMKSAKAAAPKNLRRPSARASVDQMGMLQNLFVDHLKDIYWAEKAATKAMPRMRRAATTPELQQAFDQHMQVTTQQIARLEQVFELLGKKAQGKKCDAMEGLIKETESVISETEKGSKTRDVGLIIAAQKMEHYEIASYGGLAQLAKTMRLEEVKNLLGQTLDEEKQADELLTQVAENNINIEAEQEGEESEGGGGSDEEGKGGGLDKVADETTKDAGDED